MAIRPDRFTGLRGRFNGFQSRFTELGASCGCGVLCRGGDGGVAAPLREGVAAGAPPGEPHRRTTQGHRSRGHRTAG
eukprot:9417035-Pyramimonas_sp.AAC.1